MGEDNFLQRLLQRWRENKNLRLSTVAIALLVCAGAVWVGIYFVINQQKNQLPVMTNVRAIDVDVAPAVFEPTEENTTPRLIDGVLVTEDSVNPHPIGIMIENAGFDNVRPQFGLSDANVVYELIVEGGITRFMAIFASDLPEKIGPVRSARPTYLEFISEYNGVYAHAGGSPEALQAIDGLNIKDLSALGGDSRFYYRDTGRPAPHNLFTSGELLTFALRDKSLDEEKVSYDSWSFKDEAPSAELDATIEHTIDIDFGSGPLYQVRYVFDATTNTYQRYNGGELQHDANNDEVITTKNVIVQIVPSGVSTGDDGRINFSVTGEGKAYIARDGKMVEGRWEKSDRVSRTQFYTNNGEIIELNRGNTWVTILPETGTITYN